MANANSLKIVSYVIVSVVLFIAYACVFGQQSIRRYLEGAVIITEHEEIFELSSMQPPGKKYIHIYLFLFFRTFLIVINSISSHNYSSA